MAPVPRARPHALVVPFPAQGHVIPLMEVAHALADRGVAVTFVNTEFNHARVVAAMSSSPVPSKTEFNTRNGSSGRMIRLVAVPDGMGPDEDRNNLVRLTMLMQEHMAPRVEELIRRSGRGGEEEGADGDGLGRITCVVADYNVGTWALDVARGADVRSAAVWPASAAVMASLLSIPKLIQDRIIDAEDGSALTQETFQLSPDMPVMNPAHLAWNCIGNDEGQELLFRYLLAGVRAVDECDYILCNSFRGAEAATFARFPKIVPVGPLLTGERPGKPVGHFWRPEEDACMDWLDAQPARSVVYVAFGSFTMFDRRQFQELALGLELTGRPFLWVVRPDIVHGDVHEYPEGFLDRTASGRGKLVSWAPQQRVLAHPAVACFVSHCGWNSTMEGIRNGVPLVAWPYFADQFVNRAYICDIWRIGVQAVADGKSGVITKEHIAGRVEEVMGDAGMRKRVEALMAAAHESVQEGGCSHGNFDMFVEAITA
ncbi:UDP-glycosyltransferase 83A1-like [Oryza brachyantha]|uniref:UDP-glycosyltransferase 83A1-like n=1 Tax=Oryza brachyantha TaxID=4533 RepID=UPI0003EACED1|nr:UDP-glycosyltransferase 83A1-like [Oryza brachyantha]